MKLPQNVRRRRCRLAPGSAEQTSERSGVELVEDLLDVPTDMKRARLGQLVPAEPAAFNREGGEPGAHSPTS
jgi:hypothetical protein